MKSTAVEPVCSPFLLGLGLGGVRTFFLPYKGELGFHNLYGFILTLVLLVGVHVYTCIFLHYVHIHILH